MANSWTLQEKLAGQGWLFTSHAKDLSRAEGHGRDAPGLTIERIRARHKEGFPVIGAKCGIKVSEGRFSVVIDADSPGLFDWFEREYPDTFGKTLTAIGSKPGHFYFTTDIPVESSAIDTMEKIRAIDILGAGRCAIMPPSPHRKTGKPYKLLRDAEPVFMPWKSLEASLIHAVSANGLVWKRLEEKTKNKNVPRDDLAEAIKHKIGLFDIEAGLKPGLQSCPLPGHLHGDKNPSLSITEDGQLFNCFSKHGGGDIFSWVMQRDGMEFPEAKEFLRKKAGIKTAKKIDPLAGIDELLLNPIVPIDRFGQGVKDGTLYYGVPIADNTGRIHPAVFYGGQLLAGTLLDSAGFKFGSDFSLTGETWNRKLLYDYRKQGQHAPTTKELIDRIISINRRFAYHDRIEVHYSLAAYVLNTYLFSIFPKIGRILIFGMPGSGKSTQSELLAKLCFNPLISPDASPATIYRTIEATAGTVIIDNFDTLREDTRSVFSHLFDTSYQDGLPVLRCEEKTRTPKSYRTYCPMIVNCIDPSWMPKSSTSRTIFIRMLIADTTLERLENLQIDEAEKLRHDCRLWALENHARIAASAAGVKLFQNRDADIARPLLAILNDADPAYFKAGSEFLQENFDQYHREEEFEQRSQIILILWGMLAEKYTPKTPLITIPVRDVAAALLNETGFPEFIKDEPNPKFRERLSYTCRQVAGVMKTLPFNKQTRPQNAVHFEFSAVALAKFLKTRGFELGDAGKKVLQGVLV